MTRPQILTNAINVSRKRHKLSVTSDWRYPRFLDFLQISPSYRLAHMLAVGKVKRRGLVLPADFREVEKTYSAFGDVTQTYFWDWWLKTAQYQFGVSRYWMTAAGGYYFQVWYGSKVIELKPGLTAVQVSKREELVDVVRSIIDAVRYGELDVQIEDVAERNKEQLRKAPPPKLLKKAS